jgi:hypothetical protein
LNTVVPGPIVIGVGSLMTLPVMCDMAPRYARLPMICSTSIETPHLPPLAV